MYVGNVKTPTLLITGEKDLRTPMPQTEEYYSALKYLEGADGDGAAAGRVARLLLPAVEHDADVVDPEQWFDRYRKRPDPCHDRQTD